MLLLWRFIIAEEVKGVNMNLAMQAGLERV
jgi:hypothetical protein